MIWFKPWDASMWTEVDAGDSTTHVLISFSGLDRAAIQKDIKFAWINGVLKIMLCHVGPPAAYGSGGVDDSWYFVAITWSKPQDRIREYFNGLPNTHLWWENTGLTTYDTGLINNIGIGTRAISPLQYWHGHLGPFCDLGL